MTPNPRNNQATTRDELDVLLATRQTKAIENLGDSMDALLVLQRKSGIELLNAVKGIKMPQITAPNFDPVVQSLKGVEQAIRRVQVPDNRELIDVVAELSVTLAGLSVDVDFSPVSGAVDRLSNKLDGLQTLQLVMPKNAVVKLDEDDLKALKAASDWRTHQPYITEYVHDQGVAGTEKRGSGITFLDANDRYQFVGDADPLPVSATFDASIVAILQGIEDNTDGLEGFTDGIEASLTALQGYVDGVEALLTTINTSVDGLEGFVDGLEALLDLNADVDNNYVAEDTSFTAGESPITHDLNTALGGNSTRGYIRVRTASVTIEVSSDGSTFSDPFTLLKGTIFEWSGVLSIDTIRITHTGTNAAYYLNAWR